MCCDPNHPPIATTGSSGTKEADGFQLIAAQLQAAACKLQHFCSLPSAVRSTNGRGQYHDAPHYRVDTNEPAVP
jgi:hypothetical protein